MTYTDKGDSGYIPTYKGLAQTLPKSPAICELGVYQGGSLELWQAMWPDAAVIVGVDIDPNARWPEGTVRVIADQQSPLLEGRLREILARSLHPGPAGYNLIIDDASHQGHQTYKSFQHLWKLVAPGGYYVIEDWCVWNGHHGNYDDSMLALAQMLPTMFDTPETTVHFINFVYGMIIIRKKEEVRT